MIICGIMIRGWAVWFHSTWIGWDWFWLVEVDGWMDG